MNELDPCIYDDSLLEDSQFYSQEKYSWKCENDDSLLGEQTPHERGKRLHKKLRVVARGAGAAGEEAGGEMREIPLPELSWADRTELGLLMCFKEDVLDRERDPHMFRKHPTLTPRMRSILLDWLMEVCDVYKLRRVTYYLAVDYVDRYLSRADELPKNQLQLLGITCLFVAAKVEEVYPPKLAELAYVTDGACSDRDMLLKELAVLQVLNWDITPLTVSGWLNLYLQLVYAADAADTGAARGCVRRAALDDDFVFPQFSAFSFVRASQLLDLCSLDERMLRFPYGVLAAAALYFVFNREKALAVSGFAWEHIAACVRWMAPFHSVVSKLPPFGALEGPKDRPRGNSGLKRCNPRILVNEAHCVQTHTISLRMLEDVYKLGSEQCDWESAEESSEQKSSRGHSSDEAPC